MRAAMDHSSPLLHIIKVYHVSSAELTNGFFSIALQSWLFFFLLKEEQKEKIKVGVKREKQQSKSVARISASDRIPQCPNLRFTTVSSRIPSYYPVCNRGRDLRGKRLCSLNVFLFFFHRKQTRAHKRFVSLANCCGGWACGDSTKACKSRLMCSMQSSKESMNIQGKLLSGV